ncbi:MAG TPA: amidohydrolase family protein [Gaiellales bacterium]|nr:amidohydrolase family protein [Gaiellales bacterium]
MPPLDLSAVPIVDNHCHGLLTDTAPLTAAVYRHRFSECAGEPFPADHTATAVHYLWALRQIAGALGCEPSEQAVLEARAARSQEELDRTFLRSANIARLLIDDGYPDPAETCDRETAAHRGGFAVGWVERVETVAGRLVLETGDRAGFDDALDAHLASARARGVCGFKSVAAYRTGLAIERPTSASVTAALEAMRESGSDRVAAKPLVDHIVLRTMEAAADQELPVQFHAGYGDADLNMGLADPLHLTSLLRAFPTVPVVILHGAYPYTRKAAVLATTYANAYLDVSYAIPFLTAPELRAVTRHALGAAPSSRVLYSSDAVGIPEQHGLGAVRGRAAIGATLGELVDDDCLSQADAMAVAARILHENAERIYAL